ncbi:MAG: AbrB/MazE/SpoVT family DNA-binding domain-containing protein [Chloroflexi bacterium]|nr:AbrB/MazE/SpoVT family DNA-binding domain-containing protein [Chloroflexota bacterium]
MARIREQFELRIGRQGRLVIPAPLRKALEIEPGDTVVVRIEDSRIVLEKREAILARVRERFRCVPAEVDLANELIQERREEARRETAR